MIIVAHEKHSTFTYKSALSCLSTRVNDGYWYYGEDADRAKAALAAADEDAAWLFLESRSHAEYEYVERQVPR